MTPTASIQAIKKNKQEEPTNIRTKMQDVEGKASRKSDEIAAIPMRAGMAAVTLHTTTNERAQAQSKKAKKKGLEGYFGVGARVPPPTLEGTPTDAAGKRKGGEIAASGRIRGGGRAFD